MARENNSAFGLVSQQSGALSRSVVGLESCGVNWCVSAVPAWETGLGGCHFDLGKLLERLGVEGFTSLVAAPLHGPSGRGAWGFAFDCESTVRHLAFALKPQSTSPTTVALAVAGAPVHVRHALLRRHSCRALRSFLVAGAWPPPHALVAVASNTGLRPCPRPSINWFTMLFTGLLASSTHQRCVELVCCTTHKARESQSLLFGGAHMICRTQLESKTPSGAGLR